MGKKLHEYPHLNKFGNRANDIYGLANQEQLPKLMKYLHLNGGYELNSVQNRALCMYAAIRRGIDVPREYTNTPLRHQLVIYVLKNIDFSYPVLQLSIMVSYGHIRISQEEYSAKEKEGTLTPQEIADQRLPGFLSMHRYLQHLLT